MKPKFLLKNKVGSAKAGMKGDALNDDIGLAIAKHVDLRVTKIAIKIKNDGII